MLRMLKTRGVSCENQGFVAICHNSFDNCLFPPPDAPVHTEETSVVVLATDLTMGILIGSVCHLL